MRRLGYVLAAAMAAFLIALWGPADGQQQPAPSPQLALSRMAPRAIAAGSKHVVLIRPGGETRAIRRRGRSGVVIAKDVVVTSATNVDVFGVDDLFVEDANGKAVAARLRGRDLRLRLVVLHCPGLGVEPATPSPGCKPGSFVLALGAPLRDAGVLSATFGILSSTGRFQGRADQTDAGLDESNFGGALVDLEGRLHGVLVKVDPRLGQRSGVGFAIPLPLILDVLPVLMQGEQLELGDLGIGVPRVATAAKGSVEVARVSGAAGAAGLQPGDRVVSLNGVATPDVKAFRAASARVYSGLEVEVEVLRETVKRRFTIKAATKN